MVAEALRNLTHAEKQRRGEGRSYGAVVLDAIEEHQAELKKYFEANVAKPTSGLFSRVEAGPQKRRRHTTPPVKIPLAGIIPSDIDALDTLANEWQAGNRSALVDKALQLYLAREINQLLGVPEHDSAGSDEGAAEDEAASA
ncbi:hypothetical protein [Nocardia carnea]|uniref:hypothetical protein n=1 Tax=Nocardia carnea TaxID=37328 RepID=UPI000687F3BE|nr:hypothetical protein [Nocardia carnea]